MIRNGTLIDGSGKAASRNDAITRVIKDGRLIDLDPRDEMLQFEQAAE